MNYKTDIGIGKSITKKNKSFSGLKPPIIPTQNVTNENKKQDVNKLLTSHYGEDWKTQNTLKFYKYVLDGERGEQDIEVLCEQGQEESHLIV